MYELFFQLNARPFLASPIAERYYPAASVEHARETVARCIERAEGPAVILGSAGTGKSTVCQVLAHQMRDKFRVATLASARLCTRRALLQNILFELKQPYRDREEGELRLSLIDFLEPSESCPNGMLLLVDEAHALPLRLLEEIRMLTNLVRDGQPRVRLVLAASLVLDERLASPRLESFNQRIAARCYLQSMSRDETCGYVCAQISAVGGDPDQVFTEDGLHAIYRATDGIPRLVNQVCDHVLMMASIGRRTTVDAAGVEEAWADLQQLPSPWVSSETPSESSSEGAGILEFGELDGPVVGALHEDEQLAAEPAPAAESVAPQVAAHLDEIESGIAALSNDDAFAEPFQSPERELEEEEPQFRPVSTQKPEIELVFHQAHDPFSESFDDEEVIVDPFSSMEALSGKPGPSTPRDDRSATIAFHPLDEQPVARPTAEESAEIAAALPDQIRKSVARSMTDAVDSMNALPGDDRDLLDIHDDASDLSREYAVAIDQRAPRRREYRQLFANLRRK